LHHTDLRSYLGRIGFPDPVRPTITTLAGLQRAHRAAIPFENLDVLLGRQIRLDLPSLSDKLVSNHRGGYCFEQNTLFAAVLRTIGFDVTPLEARVRPPGVTKTLPRSHMTLRVDVDDRAWLVDV